MKQPSVYIIANERNGTLYTGVTSDLIKRTYEHKNGLCDGFSKKYNCRLLVYYEIYDTMEAAILREKQIQSGSRQKKINLIENMNPEWIDLYEQVI
jgi:putative endonuclease